MKAIYLRLAALWLCCASSLVAQTYRMGYGADRPFHFATPDKQPSGLAVEIVREAARRKGIPLQWIFETAGMNGIERGSVDLYVLMTDRPERRQKVHFTDPYLITETCFMVREDSAYSDPRDLQSARVSFIDLPIHRSTLKQLFPGIQLLPLPSTRAAVEAVDAGQADAAYVDQFAAVSSLLQAGNLAPMRIVSAGTARGLMGLASRNDLAPVANALRDEMRKMSADGTTARIVQRWGFFPSLTTEAIDALSDEKRRVRLLAAGAGVLCLLLGATVWLAWRLRCETTSLRSAERALRRSSEHSRMLVNLLPDTLYTVDEENTITVRNEGSRQTEMVKALENSALHRRKVREALSTGDTVLEEEKIDEELYVEYRLVPLGSDQPGKVMGILRDVTERRKTEALHAALGEAQKLEIVGRLAGGVANDFNNLLTVINGYSDALLKNTDFDPQIRVQLEGIQRAGATAAELTQNLLAFSRKQTLDLRRLDVNSIVRNLDILIRRVIGENVRLETKLAADLYPVMGDPGQISQILMNLVVNARDAMPHGGELSIQTSNPDGNGGYVLISVTDNGTGMSERAKAHLLEPFFTTRELGKGAGLGLATVYGIVRQLGGNIVVESEQNQGCTFRIYLPAVHAHASAAG